MPPGDSLNECSSPLRPSSSRILSFSEKMEEEDWESRVMEEARFLKGLSDELKEAGCPYFGGRYCSSISMECREKAAILDEHLDSLIGFDSRLSSFKTQTRDILRLLLAQGDTLSAFKDKMKLYDFSLKCNAVWASDAIAYRCNTCAYNPCMSLCAECFQNSNHEGHDFNRFFSQAGGACDCGDLDVLRESGFCGRHGPNAKRPPSPSSNVVSLAEFAVPKLFVRLFLYFRGWNRRYNEYLERQRPQEASKEAYSSQIVHDVRTLIELLQELVDCGGPLRDAVSRTLLNTELYSALSSRRVEDDLEDKGRPVDFSLDWRTRSLLEEDVCSLKSVAGVQSSPIEFTCLLDELVFWMIRLIFPQSIINLCLSLLSDIEYRDAFACRFFSLYPRIAEIMADLTKSERNTAIYAVSSRIIHISVQILSSEAMCVKLDDRIGLVRLMLSSTYGLLSIGVQNCLMLQDRKSFYSSTPPSAEEQAANNVSWKVFSVEANQPLRKHSYWTLVSDMQNLLGHAPIARRFFRDPIALSSYAKMIEHMQGMNVNFRVISGDHIEYDTAQPYQLSFHLEWEVAALNMFSTLSALTDEEDCMRAFFLKFKNSLQRWLTAIHMEEGELCTPPFSAAYHLPLHRHVSACITHCLYHRAFREILNDLAVKDNSFLRKIALHPIRIQVCRAETSAGMWARNGNAARNQSFYYAQTNYNTAFLDSDLALLRFIASAVDTEFFFSVIVASFYLNECFSSDNLLDIDYSSQRVVTRKEWIDSLVDGVVRLLLELVVIRWNVGSNDVASVEKEVVAALAVTDLTYSKLKSAIPEKGSRSAVDDDCLDEILKKLAAYSEPDQGSHIQQGVYKLTAETWKTHFDPVFCRSRATTAREFNDALLRAEEVERSFVSRPSGGRSCDHLWIPFRLLNFNTDPSEDVYSGVSNLLVSPTFFAIAHKILSLHVEHRQLSDAIFQQTVYLLSLSSKFAISRHFNSIYVPSSNEERLSSFKSMFYKLRKPNDQSKRSFVFWAINCENEDNSSILMLLIRYLRDSLSENKLGADVEGLLANALREQIEKDVTEIDRVTGYAFEYIGRLLNILYHNDFESRNRIEAIMTKKTGSPARTLATEEVSSEAKKKAEQRLAAKRRQEAVLAAHQKKNASLMRRMMIREGLTQSQMDAMDTTKSEVRHYECPICSDTTASTLEHPVGMLVRIISNYAVEHSLPAGDKLNSLLELDDAMLKNSGCAPERIMMKQCNVMRRGLLESLFAAYADQVQLPTGIEVRSCGHFAHIKCYTAYVQTLLESPSLRVNPLDSQADVACPMCRAPVHGLLPLAPDMDSEKQRCDLSNKVENKFLKNAVDAVAKTLQQAKPALSESDIENFNDYREAFSQFTSLCEKGTSNRGDIAERLHSRGQSFTLGLAKANVERNVLLSELEITDRHNRVLATEHLLYGAHYETKKRDLSFVGYQWRQLTFGFDQPKVEMEDSESGQAITSKASTNNSVLATAKETKSVVCSDEEILASSTVDAKRAMSFKEADVDSDCGTPLVLFDMKSALLRLSTFVITCDYLVEDDKIQLLAFIYEVVLFASMVRSAVVAATRLSLPQMKQIMKQIPQRGATSRQESVFSSVASSVVRRLFSRRHVHAEDLIMENTGEVDFDEGLRYACTDLARFTAQLWHETRIKQLDPEIHIGHSSFEDVHFFLTGRYEPTLSFLPEASLVKWVDVISRWISFPSVSRIFSVEPLIWRRFVLLELPESYDNLFSRFFGRTCINCTKVPRTPFICLLCGQLMCLDMCCNTSSNGATPDNEVERHAVQCGSGVGCFLSLNTSLTVIVSRNKAALWGSVYLDAHGEEDRNLKRGKPLFLSSRRFARLQADWVLQSFDHLPMGFFNFEHLPTFLRDAHYVLSA